jgi:hypothetical protein
MRSPTEGTRMLGLRRPRSSCSNTLILIRPVLIRLVLILLILVLRGLPARGQSAHATLLASLTEDFARLAPQTVRSAGGYIRCPYMIPAGYYERENPRPCRGGSRSLTFPGVCPGFLFLNVGL